MFDGSLLTSTELSTGRTSGGISQGRAVIPHVLEVVPLCKKAPLWRGIHLYVLTCPREPRLRRRTLS